MDSVLEQVIAGIGPLNLEKTGECYAKLSSLAVPQDGKLTYLAGRIAGVSDTLQPSLLKKAVVLFAADHAVDGGENKQRVWAARPLRWKSLLERAISIRSPTRLEPASFCWTWDWSRTFPNRKAFRT